MIDRKVFENDPAGVGAAIAKRGPKAADLVQAYRATDGNASTQQELEKLQAQINAANKVIPGLDDSQKKKKLSELKSISDKIARLKQDIREATPVMLPNIPADDVPTGTDETSNVVEREVGKKPSLKQAKDYLHLAEQYHLIDIPRAAKVSGSRFGYILGALAQMEFALVQYAQSVILKKGFTMIVPPVMIKEENMHAMGYTAGGGEADTYHLTDDKLYLVGTSEQSIGPMHRDEILEQADVPKRYLAFSTCFRREAGSYGKDTKGIFRVHQFDKLEMFSLTLPENSDAEHELLLSIQEELMQGLKLPYRVVRLCAGELGWPSARTYDIETWMPGQGTYRETHSTSTTTDFQSRDLNIKVKRDDGQKEYVHLLNGTAFAIGRTLISIIENYQTDKGQIEVPKVLQKWMPGIKRIG